MVLERVVAKQIEEYFETNNLLETFQFGFRKNKSSIQLPHVPPHNTRGAYFESFVSHEPFSVILVGSN